MLFSFMDESGHPHPNDSATRPVLVSVCIKDKDLRNVCTELFKLKRRILNKDNSDFEAKASQIINRSTFRNRPDKREFVESFFDKCRNLPILIFAIIIIGLLSFITTIQRMFYIQKLMMEIGNEDSDTSGKLEENNEEKVKTEIK